MKRLLPIALALAGLGTALSACHTPETPDAAAPGTSAPSATAPAAPAPAAPTAPATAPVAPTPAAPVAAPAPVAAAPAAVPTVRRATAAEAALVAEQHAARTPRSAQRLSREQREAQHEAREEFERERAAKAQRVARYGYDVPEDGEQEEHHDARERDRMGERMGERAEGKADGFDEPDQFIEYERRIRARIGGQPEYTAGYRVEAAQALDDTPASRAAKAMRETPGAMAAQGIVAITEVGPGNVSGRTRVISPDPASPLDTWLVAGVDGGFWKTSNAGTTWTHVAPYLDYLAFASIARSPRDPNVLYAGTGEGFGNSDAVRGDGIFRSTDRGETWTLLASTNRFNGFSHTNRLVVFGTGQDTVIAATNTGIFRSVDNGTSWQQVYVNGTRKIQQVISNPLRPRTLYATVNGAGVVRSGDGGTTWSSVSTGLGSGSRVEIALAPQDTTHLYAQIETSASVTGYYRSVDAGQSWAQLTGATTNVLNGQGWYDNALTVDPIDKNRVYVAGVDIYRLTAQPAPTNTGITLTRQSVWSDPSTATRYAHADHHVLLTVPNGGGFRLINGSDGGVAFTDNIGTVSGTTYPTWVKTLNAYNTSQPYSADKRAGADQFVTGLQDNGTWTSPAGSTAASAWSYRIGGDGFDTAWNQRDASLVMGSLYYNRLFRSTNGGTSFAETSPGLTEAGVNTLGPFTTRIHKVETDPDMLYVGGKTGPWRSDDFGGFWTKSRLDVPGRWFNSSPVSSMVVAAPSNPQVVYAGNAIIGASGAYAPFRSTDGGNTFASLPITGMEAMGHYMTNMATHPTDANTAYILFSAAGLPKIFRTQDGGQTWASLTGTVGTTDAVSTNGFPNVATYAMLQMPYDPSTIWAGTEIGLVVSSDNGATWARPSFSFPNVAVRQMRISDDKVIVATHGRGVFTIQLSELATTTYAAVPLAPRFDNAVQTPTGALNLVITRPTTLDSLVIRRNSQRVAVRPGNTGRVERQAESVPLTVTAARVDTFVAVGYRGGRAMSSQERLVALTPTATPVVQYVSAMDNDANFTLTGVTYATPAGFANTAVHTAHNYAASTNASLSFNSPVIVASQGATLSYDEIVIAEPCDDGSAYCATGFYDYAVAEATKDGTTWIPLAGPYDARGNATWLSTWAAAGAGTPAMYVRRTVNLLSSFAPGDVVRLRWRFVSDTSVQGWGWSLDNVAIQPTGTATDDVVAGGFAVSSVFPNPAQGRASLRLTLPAASQVRVEVYDLTGRLMARVLDGMQAAGTLDVPVDGRGWASGTYLVRVTSGTTVTTRTLSIVR